MATNTCPKSEELIPTASKNMEIAAGKRNLTDNCLYCGERLDPTKLVFQVNLLTLTVSCQSCDKKNYFGKIRQIPMPLPSPPVIKRLAGYQLRERKQPEYQNPFFDSSSSNKESSEEESEESPLTTTTENQECVSSSNRLTPEEISELMCLEAQANRLKREKLLNRKNPESNTSNSL
ncbi:hypothetical protein DAPPUDRAFT_302057 [Daphnia pulex]|uniref:Uncharacterized protein n=1 Tax=Daphnia pulex TaxID=6669 RepID=E9GBB9_DAPPU|nr:hypothetical protein DAPPUDRAFT_302057 [Daphnia pulex]|eukprot:EFX83186.1 hypothetical protein DAPPUDRAFT_302057 [Daphnia pulex]